MNSALESPIAEELVGRVVILTFAGLESGCARDDSWVESLSAPLRDRVERDGSVAVLIDFRGRDFCMNTRFLAVLLGAMRQARSSGRRFAICRAAEGFREMTRVPGPPIFEYFPDRPSALSALDADAGQEAAR